MAENKKSFILYADQISLFENLDDLEAGILIKHIFRYVNDLNPEPPDKMTLVAFEPIKQQLKRDLKSWESFRIKQSENGKLGGRPKNQLVTEKPSVTHIKPNNPGLISETQKSLNVNANVTVNANASSINKKDIVSRKLAFATTLKDFNGIYPREMLKDFYEYWSEENNLNTKFKMEFQKTWNLKRRLNVWHRNEKFNKKETDLTKKPQLSKPSVDISGGPEWMKGEKQNA